MAEKRFAEWGLQTGILIGLLVLQATGQIHLAIVSLVGALALGILLNHLLHSKRMDDESQDAAWSAME